MTRQLTLVASDVAPVGGMERVVYELARRLRERGWELTVIARSCALPPGGDLRFVRLLSPGRPVSLALAASFVQGTWELRRHRRGLVQTNNVVVGGRVDIVNVHFCERAYRDRVGLSRSRRGDPLFRLNSWLAAREELAAERWGYRPGRVRRLTAVSSGLAAELRRHYPAIGDRVVAIPNGVDRAAFAPDPTERERVRTELGLTGDALVGLFVGGDWQRKQLATAIAAVGGAPGWQLLVVGDGDQAHFAAQAARCGAGERVHFVGPVADPSGHYRAADALVFPSAYEAFSLVTLEAAAAGLVLLTARINGTEELVQEGVNGWFTGTDAAAIAERLTELAADRGHLAAMGAAARRSSTPFDWERVVDAYEALYAELAAGSSAATAANGSVPARRRRRSSRKA